MLYYILRREKSFGLRLLNLKTALSFQVVNKLLKKEVVVLEDLAAPWTYSTCSLGEDFPVAEEEG